MWASVLVLAVSLAVGAASEGQEDNAKCFLQIEGKYNVLMGYSGGLGWRKIDSDTGNAVEGFDIFWYETEESFGQYVIGSRPDYFATVGGPEGASGRLLSQAPEKQKCLPDGSTVRMKDSDEIVAKIWRLKAPYFSSCPVKAGTPGIAEGGNVVSLSENTWSSLRDCLDVASNDLWMNTELTAVIYEENEGRCKGVTNQTEFEWDVDADHSGSRSCFFQCLPLPGYPFQNSQLATTTDMGQKDSFEECRAAVVSAKPPPQSAGPLWTVSNESCQAVAEANQFQAMLASPDSSPMFRWCWHPRTIEVETPARPPPVIAEGCYHNSDEIFWEEHCDDLKLCEFDSSLSTEEACVASALTQPLWAANEFECRHKRLDVGNCQIHPTIPDPATPIPGENGCYVAIKSWAADCASGDLCRYDSFHNTEEACENCGAPLSMWAANESACRQKLHTDRHCATMPPP